uniref:Uncharacterized protein n=1 Tax=Candidatus Kentrum sp. FM TaxID=2126340 RepID=A0A450VTF6_9GAMM|nr:MAG: hypothetical protein BECKFM1743C_GA0114222_1005910 [Candidatus Kentron sp. FM]VFJ50106.1 MAG: hypothetical protein BECKFM1743A_GA0114220_100803 [Candidatus Kentron sp. FM]VFK08098.1 MAG: hypothetical protein BECKFM1743B_GA0114221_1005910 [Candidatus Kentron sp. FM]
MEKWIYRKKICQGAVFSAHNGQVKPDDGTITYREVASCHGGVAIVPVLKSSVILVRQYRIAMERGILQIPAGPMEKGGPPSRYTAAHRERMEEAGFDAGTWIPGPQCHASRGRTAEKFHLHPAPRGHEKPPNLHYSAPPPENWRLDGNVAELSRPRQGRGRTITNLPGKGFFSSQRTSGAG